MNEQVRDVVIDTKIRLARNYPEYPFDTTQSEQIAGAVKERTENALKAADLPLGYTPLSALSAGRQKYLAEEHIITEDLLKNNDTAGFFREENGHVSVMVNEEDHLRFLAVQEGCCLNTLADEVFSLSNAIEKQTPYAFDSQWGYLTACPTNAGTGLKASLVMHLPMITMRKQLGSAIQSVVKVGLTMRGLYGEGNQAQGFVFQISNRVTLGKSEQDILDAVNAVGGQMIALEREMRNTAMQEDRTAIEDNVWRAYGLLKNARRMALKEFMVHWSNLRLGAALEILPVSVSLCDQILLEAQSAHAESYVPKGCESARRIDEARAAHIRALLS